MAGQGTRTVSFEAGELMNVTIKRVSIVDRGANRVPFRIEKRDSSTSEEGNDVLNFAKLSLKKADKEPKEATIACLVLGSGADLDEAKARVEKSGVQVPEGREWAQDAEGNHYLAFVDEVPKDGQFYKFDDEAGVVLQGAESVVDVVKQSMDFSENLGAAQFIPGMFMANDALIATVMTVVDEADSKGSAVDAIKSATEAFGNTLVAAAEAIPEDVFKLESAFAAEVEKVTDKDEDDDEKSKSRSRSKTKKAEAVEKKDEDEQEGGASNEEGEPEGVEKSEDEPEGEDKEEPKGDSEPTLADVMKAVAGFGEKLDGVSTKVEELGGQVTEAKKAADEAKVLARKSDRTGRALGGTSQGDAQVRVRTRKRERGRQPASEAWSDIESRAHRSSNG